MRSSSHRDPVNVNGINIRTYHVMKFLPFLLLPGLIKIPVIALAQKPAIAIVQQADVAQKAQVDELVTAGLKLFQQREYSAALDRFQQALAIAEKIGYKQQQLLASLGIGEIYNLRGQYPQSLKYFQKALNLSREIKDKSFEGVTLNNIASVYIYLGKYSAAIEYFSQSLALSKEVGDKLGEGIVLNNIGEVYNLLGRYDKALEYFQQSLAIKKTAGKKANERNTLINIGSIYQELRQYSKAIDYYQESLTISKEIGDKRGEAVALTNIGTVYNLLNKYQQALEYHQQSLAISKEIFDKRNEGICLNNIGSVYDSLGQFSKGLEYYQQSLIIRQAIGDKFGEGTTLSNIGINFLDQKKPASAEKYLRAAIAIWETIRVDKSNSGQGLSDSNKVSFADSVASTYKFLQKALIQQNKLQSALEIAERGRARALAELLAARSVQTNTTAIPKAPNLAKIQQIAKSQNATLVEYSLIENTIYIWVISPNGQIAFHQSKLPPNTNIKDLVNTSRDDIGVRGRSRSSDSTIPAATAAQGDLKLLHKLLIAPIAKSLPKDPNQRIIIIPQGELFFVPFVALQDSNNKYLIERHTISTASAIGLLDSNPKSIKINPKQGTALIVGNPIMPLAPDGSQLVSLTGAEEEAIAVGSILKTTPLIGTKADKSVVIEKMRSASIIHLATHGLLDKVRGDIPGAIALTNGFLTSNEIFDLKLQASLVVLSACDTGKGDLSGDGVIGLSRALAVAGVPSIAVSLWTVSDSSTKELMVEFYQNWYGKGMDKAQAMRQAMLEVMKTHAKPSDWAAFTILGEAR